MRNEAAKTKNEPQQRWQTMALTHRGVPGDVATFHRSLELAQRGGGRALEPARVERAVVLNRVGDAVHEHRDHPRVDLVHELRVMRGARFVSQLDRPREELVKVSLEDLGGESDAVQGGLQGEVQPDVEVVAEDEMDRVNVRGGLRPAFGGGVRSVVRGATVGLLRQLEVALLRPLAAAHAAAAPAARLGAHLTPRAAEVALAHQAVRLGLGRAAPAAGALPRIARLARPVVGAPQAVAGRARVGQADAFLRRGAVDTGHVVDAAAGEAARGHQARVPLAALSRRAAGVALAEAAKHTKVVRACQRGGRPC